MRLLLLLFIVLPFTAQAGQCISGNCMHGYGEYIYDNGDKYFGHWRNGSRNGKGSYKFSNGSVFQGSYSNGKRQGYGILTSSNGTRQAGQWKSSSFLGNNRTQNTSKPRKVATTQNKNWIVDQTGCKHWNSNPIPNEAVTWTGQCRNGYSYGYGTFQWYENKSKTGKYTGYKSGGKSHGDGKYFFTDGSTKTGRWVNGKFQTNSASREDQTKLAVEKACSVASPAATGLQVLSGIAGFMIGLARDDIGVVEGVTNSVGAARKTVLVKGTRYAC